MAVSKKTIGRETMDGHLTTRRAVVATKKGVPGLKATTWTTDDGIMVRASGKTINNGHESSFRMRLKDIRIGPQAPSLFEVPSGYMKMEVPAFVGSMGSAPPARPAR